MIAKQQGFGQEVPIKRPGSYHVPPISGLYGRQGWTADLPPQVCQVFLVLLDGFTQTVIIAFGSVYNVCFQCFWMGLHQLFSVLLGGHTLDVFSVFGWIYIVFSTFGRIYTGYFYCLWVDLHCHFQSFQMYLHWLFLVFLNGFTLAVFSTFGWIYTVFLMLLNEFALTVSSVFG